MTHTGIVGTVHGVVRKTLTVVLMCVCQVFGVEDQQALSRVGCGDPQRDSRGGSQRPGSGDRGKPGRMEPGVRWRLVSVVPWDPLSFKTRCMETCSFQEAA